MIKVSVVVPIYNVEQYIERCVHSLLSQTLEEMQFIFVNDCTQDDSIKLLLSILDKYPERKKQVVFLENNTNRGLLQTRMRGLAYAEGEYVATLDSDDWIEPNAYENLYNKAHKEDVDCLLFGYSRDFINHSELCHRVFPYSSGKELIENSYRFPFEFFTWCTLIRNNKKLHSILSLFQDKEEWEHVTMWEDVALMFLVYYYAKKVSYSSECYYHYNKSNLNSAVNTQDVKKVRDAYKVVDFLETLFYKEKCLQLTINCLKFGAKSVLMDIKGLDAWRHEHSEANKDLMKYTSIPLKVRLFYWLLLKWNWPYRLLK